MNTSIHTKCNFPQVSELQKKVEISRYIIGLDLHKETTAVTIIDQQKDKQNPIFQRKRVKNDDLLSLISKYSDTKIVVAEASFGWKMLRDALKEYLDITFIIFDPRKTAAWVTMSGIKNDKVDSEILAYACINGGIPRLAVFQPSEEHQEQFRFAIFRDRLVKQRTSIKNQLKALQNDYIYNPYNRLKAHKSNMIVSIENDLLDQLNFLNQKINAIEKRIHQINQNDAFSLLLKSIPGIGEITAFALRAKVDTISRFEDSRHFCSYFGMGIRQHQIGEHFRNGKITKTGNQLIRMLMIQGAQVVGRHHPEYFSLYFPDLSEKMIAAKKKNILIVAVARKMFTFAYYCWKNKKAFDIETYKEMRERYNLKTNFTANTTLCHRSTSKATELV